MSVPEPRANPILLGHPEAEATILDAISAGRMHHAWLITGPEGVGKATLAYRFARRLLAGRPSEPSLALDPTDPIFRRVAANSHADMLTIERVLNEKTKRMKTQIAVEDVRKINGFMSLTPPRVAGVSSSSTAPRTLTPPRPTRCSRFSRNRRRAPSCCWSAPHPAACCRPSAAAVAACA
jgi:hypothetical protein